MKLNLTPAILKRNDFRIYAECSNADSGARYHLWLRADGTSEKPKIHKNDRTGGKSFRQGHRCLTITGKGEGAGVYKHFMAAVTPESLAALEAERVETERREKVEREASALRHRASTFGPEMLDTIKLAAHTLAEVNDVITAHAGNQDVGRFMALRTKLVEHIRTIDPAYYGLVAVTPYN